MSISKQLPNPHISDLAEDVLYHFALGTKSHDLKQMFGDVKFVCIGGSANRMLAFAEFMVAQLDYQMPAGQTLSNISGSSDRYAMYKVGPVLAVSHGMGIPSVAIMLHELIKLIHHAQATDVVFLRLGTSGGLGLPPGTVVISDATVDGLFKSSLDQPVLGHCVSRPACLDQQLVSELMQCARSTDHFRTIRGKTMCTLDFYEGQGRLDGAFCNYSAEDKMNFLRLCCEEHGVCNMEMESLCFAAMCHEAGLPGGVVCVTLLDRLLGDQVDSPASVLREFGTRPQQIVARFIRKRLGLE